MAMATATLLLLHPPFPKPATPPLHALPAPTLLHPKPHSHSLSLLFLLPRRRSRGDPIAALPTTTSMSASMLADGVRELDELGLWEPWISGAGSLVGRGGAVETGRPRKVYLMGKSRRDHGVVPILESVGVRLSSAKIIAPYVSSAKILQLSF